MSEENNCNDKFDEAIAAAKELRGGGGGEKPLFWLLWRQKKTMTVVNLRLAL